MVKWEYKFVFIGSSQGEKILNGWASAGWELMNVTKDNMAIMKKKKE